MMYSNILYLYICFHSLVVNKIYHMFAPISSSNTTATLNR